MKDEKSVRRHRSLGALLVLALAGGVFCVSRPPEQPTHPGAAPAGGGKLSPECRDELRAQQRLARLAIDAMRTYGRIDPGLYDTSPSEDRSSIRISKDAKALPVNDRRRAGATLRPRATPDQLDDTLRKLPELEAKKFLEAHAAALKNCGADCPPKVYEIEVEKLDFGDESDAYSFEVKGTPPTLKEWEQGFLPQYRNVAGQCPFAPPIQLDELQRQTIGTYSRGTSEERVRCDTLHPPEDKCEECETAEGATGGYKKKGPSRSCCYKTCPPGH